MMDRALKERIIGATVLVVVAVLIVPVFLDGPSSDEEMVTQSVTLPGQNEQPRKQQTIVLERDRSQPVPSAPQPAAGTADDTAGAPKPEPAKTRQPAEKVAATEKEPEPAAPRDESTTGLFAVQLGSFSNRENAERLAADLRKDGYAAFLSQLDTADGQLHRVRVGPQKDRESAESVAARLTAAGHKGQVVPHP